MVKKSRDSFVKSQRATREDLQSMSSFGLSTLSTHKYHLRRENNLSTRLFSRRLRDIEVPQVILGISGASSLGSLKELQDGSLKSGIPCLRRYITAWGLLSCERAECTHRDHDSRGMPHL